MASSSGRSRSSQQPGCFGFLTMRRRRNQSQSTTPSCDAQAAAPIDLDDFIICTDHPNRPVTIPHGELMAYLRQHGSHSYAYSTLQPGLHHFLMPGIGFIAYGFRSGLFPALGIQVPVVLSDPICAPEHRLLMARAFLQRWPKAEFVAVTKEMAQLLNSLGLYANSMGGETVIDATRYTLGGRAKRGLRSDVSGAIRAGITVEQLSPITPAVAAEMTQVSAAWAAVRAYGAEHLWFVSRQPVYREEPDVVVLAARAPDGSMLAWVAFDPMWEGGRISGYLADVVRYRPEAHTGAVKLIMKTFLDRRDAAGSAAPAATKPKKTKVKGKAAKAAAVAASPLPADPTTPSDEVPFTQLVDLCAKSEAAAGPLTRQPDLVVSVEAGSDSSGTPRDSPRGDQWRVLSLGLSPAFALKDDGEMSHHWYVAMIIRLSYKYGEPVYPCKSVAQSKARYGAGLTDGVYKDPHVDYQMQYLCHSNGLVGSVCMMADLLRWQGMIKGLGHAVGVMLAHQARKLGCRATHTSGQADEASEHQSDDAGGQPPRSAQQQLSSQEAAKQQQQKVKLLRKPLKKLRQVLLTHLNQAA